VANWHVRPLAAPEFLPGEGPTKAEHDQLLVRLWRQGRPEREIGEVLDLERTSVGPYVRELRDAGEDLPYRRPPRGATEVAARRGGKAALRRVRTGSTSGFPRMGCGAITAKGGRLTPPEGRRRAAVSARVFDFQRFGQLGGVSATLERAILLDWRNHGAGLYQQTR
jgi:hypothetical protein